MELKKLITLLLATLILTIGSMGAAQIPPPPESQNSKTLTQTFFESWGMMQLARWMAQKTGTDVVAKKVVQKIGTQTVALGTRLAPAAETVAPYAKAAGTAAARSSVFVFALMQNGDASPRARQESLKLDDLTRLYFIRLWGGYLQDPVHVPKIRKYFSEAVSIVNSAIERQWAAGDRTIKKKIGLSQVFLSQQPVSQARLKTNGVIWKEVEDIEAFEITADTFIAQNYLLISKEQGGENQIALAMAREMAVLIGKSYYSRQITADYLKLKSELVPTDERRKRELQNGSLDEGLWEIAIKNWASKFLLVWTEPFHSQKFIMRWFMESYLPALKIQQPVLGFDVTSSDFKQGLLGFRRQTLPVFEKTENDQVVTRCGIGGAELDSQKDSIASLFKDPIAPCEKLSYEQIFGKEAYELLQKYVLENKALIEKYRVTEVNSAKQNLNEYIVKHDSGVKRSMTFVAAALSLAIDSYVLSKLKYATWLKKGAVALGVGYAANETSLWGMEALIPDAYAVEEGKLANPMEGQFMTDEMNIVVAIRAVMDALKIDHEGALTDEERQEKSKTLAVPIDEINEQVISRLFMSKGGKKFLDDLKLQLEGRHQGKVELP
ncbi:MAG: hypothetical protein IT289_00185 [Oligoflexia bacterium]|nr:hypothetical protein [Oligoflexia bacterium]